jgi:hypothetical protein
MNRSEASRIPQSLRSFADVDAWLTDQKRRRFLRALTRAHGKAR